MTGQSGLGRRERREISRSTASRMNSARLFGPAMASIRSACASVRRTSTGLVADLALSGGRPMRPVVADIGMFVNSVSKAISLIDVLSDIAYKGNIEARETKMTARKFQSPQHQAAYERVRRDGIPRFGASIYWAYRNGLHGNEARAVRGSASYAFWAAGHDNYMAKTPGAQDCATFTRLRDLPEWMIPICGGANEPEATK